MTTSTGVITGASVAHDRATVDEIDGAALDSQTAAVEQLLTVPEVEEAFVLQTCNRSEAFVVTEDGSDGRTALEALFASVPRDVIVDFGHEESLRHLMRVASGLESLVLGEDQILGQVRDAYEDARGVGGIGPLLEEGVTKAIHVGERARTETAINEGSVSLASAAVKLAAEETDIEGATGLVVGVGDMGRLAAKNLADPLSELYVANRTRANAEQVAEAVDASAEVVGLGEVTTVLDEAAVVVTATGRDGHVFGPSSFEGAGETLVVDIAQPRDVDPNAAGNPGVTVHDLDTLETVTDENERKRERAATEVEKMIDVEFEHLLARYKRKRADKVISAMYESAERVKDREVETAIETADFDEDQREVIDAMADAIVNQLLAAPTRSLRDAAEEDDWSTINTALQLFDPDFGPDSVSPPSAVGPAGPDRSGEEIPDHVREQMPDSVLDRISDD